jgi:hypothetical protein
LIPFNPTVANTGSKLVLIDSGYDCRRGSPIRLWLTRRLLRLQAYFGHKNIQLVRYTELAPDRFKNFWRD